MTKKEIPVPEDKVLLAFARHAWRLMCVDAVAVKTDPDPARAADDVDTNLIQWYCAYDITGETMPFEVKQYISKIEQIIQKDLI